MGLDPFKPRGDERTTQPPRGAEILLQSDQVAERNERRDPVDGPVPVQAQERGRRCEAETPRLENTCHLRNRAGRGRQITENLDAENDVEARVGKGEMLDVRLPDVGLRVERTGVLEHLG